MVKPKGFHGRFDEKWKVWTGIETDSISQNADWDLNPHARTRTQVGT